MRMMAVAPPKIEPSLCTRSEPARPLTPIDAPATVPVEPTPRKLLEPFPGAVPKTIASKSSEKTWPSILTLLFAAPPAPGAERPAGTQAAGEQADIRNEDDRVAAADHIEGVVVVDGRSNTVVMT